MLLALIELIFAGASLARCFIFPPCPMLHALKHLADFLV